MARAIVAAELALQPQADNCAQLTQALEATFARLHQLLTTLVGPAGFNALLLRSVDLTGKRWPWLRQIALSAQTQVVITGPSATAEADALAVAKAKVVVHDLTRLCATHGEAEVLEATTHLLATVLRVLSEFIGEELAFRLVRRVWKNLPELAA